MNDDGTDSDIFYFEERFRDTFKFTLFRNQGNIEIAIKVVPVIFAFLTCIDHMEFFTEEGGKLFTCSYLLTTKLKAPQLLDLENKEAILH